MFDTLFAHSFYYFWEFIGDKSEILLEIFSRNFDFHTFFHKAHSELFKAVNVRANST
jgi:hypothetical protein